MPYQPKPEQAIKRLILNYLDHIPRCVVFPISTMGVWDPVKHIYRKTSMVIGTPDILACINGMFVAIEVKAHPNKPTEAQELIRQRIKCVGRGMAVVAYSLEDVKKFLAPLISEMRE